MLNKEEYTNYCKKYNMLFKYMKDNCIDRDTCIKEICKLRKYDYDTMKGILYEAEFIKLKDDFNYSKLKISGYKDFGLFTEGDSFLLGGRYIFPVKDMLGNIIALIGWFNDEKKYITTPSKFFKKDCLFYGMEQLGSSGIGKNYFIVEGIFDSLSLRALGYKAVAQMGIDASKYKEIMYGLFNRLIAIPDNDKQGRGVVDYNKWHLRDGSSYVKLVGYALINGVEKRVKDIDDVCKLYNEEDIIDFLNDLWTNSNRVITLKL